MRAAFSANAPVAARELDVVSKCMRFTETAFMFPRHDNAAGWFDHVTIGPSTVLARISRIYGVFER